jgi:hypothetical protein
MRKSERKGREKEIIHNNISEGKKERIYNKRSEEIENEKSKRKERENIQ